MPNKIEQMLPGVMSDGIVTTKNVDKGTTASTSGVSDNYISSETGVADNVFVAVLQDTSATNVALTAGLRIKLKLGRRLTLDTTATLALNSGAAKNIKSQSSGALGNNLHTTLLTGAILSMIYDGTRWQVEGY